MSDSQPKQSDSDPVNNSLDFIQECPVCDHKYDIESVRIIERNEEVSLVHITCQDCFSSVLAVVVMTDVGASSIGVLTDLGPKDVDRLKKQSNFSHDEVLEFHLLLQKEKEFESALISETNQVKVNQ